jgi:aspartyl-tRNA(Asn)/glutamyl-tRNA(Gln) amidotransferase subunit A
VSEDLAYLPAIDLIDDYRAKRLSPVEATQAALDRIAAHNETLNAFLLVDAEGALAAARASEARWAKGQPLGEVDGVPTGIKDIVLSKGWPTLRGSRTVDPDQAWDEDAPCVARLREQGAVFLGKTTTPEFGWKGLTDGPLTGITRNPWNTDKTPGGSSGGASAALAAGMGTLHIGTDGAGSIRIPAGFTGVFGFKPTFGRVPAYPASPFGTISHVGPMARTVRDAALMLDVLALPDSRDWFALPHEQRSWRAGLDEGVAGMRVAFSPALGYAKVDPEVAEIVATAARAFEDLGAQVEDRDPGFEDPTGICRVHWYAGAAAALDGLPPEKKALLEEPLAEIVAKGSEIRLLDYLAAVGARTALGQHMNRFHEDFDLLLTPALAVPAFDVGLLWPEGWEDVDWMRWTPFTYPFNLTQQPACSIPCGFTADGLPVGLQIVGPKFGDDMVLRAARAYETANPLHDRRPSL